MDSELRDFVRDRANGICEYCQTPEEFDRLPFQLDHIIAEKHGGTTHRENLAWSCFDCNIYKGPNIAGIDPGSGQIVPLFHPRQNDWHDHFTWQGPEIHGLTPSGRATVAVLRLNLERRVAVRGELIAEGLIHPE